MRQPVGQQQGAVFGLVAFVEHDDEFAPVRTKSLQRMGITGRKIPEITGLDILHISATLRIEHGDAAAAIGHDRPFGGPVPVHLTNAPGPSRMLTPETASEIAKSDLVT